MIKEAELLSFLEARNLTLGAVESITGGLFASTICSVPGASKVFKGSLVTYSCELKESILGISKDAIERYGVVSNEIAYLMAKKGSEILHSDITIAVTGNAGPDKEEGAAEVGQVWIGVSYQKRIWTIPVKFNLERNDLRKATVSTMFNLIRSLFPDEKN